MATIVINYSDSENSQFNTLNPDGTAYNTENLGTDPITKNSIGEYKMLKLCFDISGDYLSDDLTNKRVKFTPALFNFLSTPFPSLGFASSNRFEFTITDTSDLTEYDMNLVCAAGYDEDIIKNWKCTIQLIDANSFIIRFYFYQIIDDHDWMKPAGKDNHIKLLRSSKHDTSDLPTSPYSTSVYKATTQRLGYYLFMDDITDPSGTKGYKSDFLKYQAGWYNRSAQDTDPFFTTPVFTLERDAAPVTNLSPVTDTNLEFRITAPSGKELSRCFIWMIRTNSTDNAVDFKDNYAASFGRIVTDAGTDQIDGNLYEPSTGPTNDTGDEWYVDCLIKATGLSYSEKYRFIGIAYFKDEDEYEVNSFISDEYTVDDLPVFDGEGFEIIGTLKDYNREFTGNELICVVEERIKSVLQINFPADQYKDDILARLGLSISNDIRTYMPTILMEIYEEVVSGPNTTKHILDRKIFTKTSPTTYTSNTGSTLTFGTDEATFEYDFRVRFESGITNLESQLNGVVLPSPTSNQNWAGRTIKIEWKLIFYYNDYVFPFEESVRFIQKIKPKTYETGSKLTLQDVRKETPILFCNSDDICFTAEINPGVGEGNSEDYRLITTIEPETGNVNNIEEHEEWVGEELPQLTNSKILSQETSFSETDPDKANFCINPDNLIFGTVYKICAIAKFIPYEFTNENARSYYNSLVSQNDDEDIDSVSIWGITLNEYKEAIDDLFIELGNVSVYNKLKEGYIFYGDNVECAKINFINPLTYGAFYGSPVFNGNFGFVLDGINDYFETYSGINIFNSNSDLGYTFDVTDLTGMNQYDYFFYTSTTGFQCWHNNTVFMNYALGASYVTTPLSACINTANNDGTDTKCYINGIFSNQGNVGTGTLTADKIIIGKEGSNYNQFKCGFFILHDCLTAQESLDLYTAFNNFKTALGL